LSASGVKQWSDVWVDVRRSVYDFLVVPGAAIVFFLVLAVVTFTLDQSTAPWLTNTRNRLDDLFLAEEATAETLLSTLAGGMITMTSITFSLLLLAVQHSASSLTTQVLDQFIRRRLNQLAFGTFVGVSLYTLVTLATNTSGIRPIFSALTALVLTCVALVLLIALLYATLNQMRANRIIEAIHDLALDAREQQHALLSHTRRDGILPHAAVTRLVRSRNNGYVADVNVTPLRKVIRDRSDLEVELMVCIGTYVCYRDVVAEVRAPDDDTADALEEAVLRALDLERQRKMRMDPAYGVTQLATIGWTSASSAHSNPSPALSCLRNLRDLAARWSAEPWIPRAPDALPVVYPDRLLADVIDALESIGVAASESLQHRCAAEVFTSLAELLERLPFPLQERAEDAVRRQLAALGDHAPVLDLEQALTALAQALARTGRETTARQVEEANRRMAMTMGHLNSRGSRVSASA
jgi:uncharacterized membrane protein